MPYSKTVRSLPVQAHGHVPENKREWPPGCDRREGAPRRRQAPHEAPTPARWVRRLGPGDDGGPVAVRASSPGGSGVGPRGGSSRRHHRLPQRPSAGGSGGSAAPWWATLSFRSGCAGRPCPSDSGAGSLAQKVPPNGLAPPPSWGPLHLLPRLRARRPALHPRRHPPEATSAPCGHRRGISCGAGR